MRVTNGTVLIREGDDLREVSIYGCTIVVDTERDFTVAGLAGVLLLMDVKLGNTRIDGCTITTTGAEGQKLAQALIQQAKQPPVPTWTERAARWLAEGCASAIRGTK